jgi:SAM-dependent methyltransferase
VPIWSGWREKQRLAHNRLGGCYRPGLACGGLAPRPTGTMRTPNFVTVEPKCVSIGTVPNEEPTMSAPQETSSALDGVSRPAEAVEAWKAVDEGWGRRAVEFATLSEPANCREYVAMHHRLGVSQIDRLLDVACGSGLAIELSRLRGASCAGIDASERLVAIARDRNPDAEIAVGDMNQLPWDDATFTVVTSFRGIWGTTPSAIAQIRRVLVPGGRVGLTVWGHIKASSGAWALAPFRMAAPQKVENQAAMVALGRPGVGEELLAQHGFIDIERIQVPFVWEFADPDVYARTIASTGPAYEAIQNVGEDSFTREASEVARSQIRDGLPLRASIKVVGFVGVKPNE